jgi:uncharacterized protein YecE (DUF72 family)
LPTRTPAAWESLVPAAAPELLEQAVELAAKAPEPAVLGRIVTGTAGWTDKMLLASGFYPASARTPGARLTYYASHFRLVEVDATYHTLLAPAITSRWVDDTPADFRFDVKAHPVLTGHPIDFSKLPSDLRQAAEAADLDQRAYAQDLPQALRKEIERRFMISIDPLREAGRLSSVLCQFPPWFTATRGNVRAIEVLAERWGALPLTVEFRHPSWLEPERRERVFALLERLRLSYVIVDEPSSSTAGVPVVPRVTNPDLAVIRFHGQNRAGWEKRGASVQERFNYLYSEQELKSWVPIVERVSREAKSVHAVFNNCVRNYAVLNAKSLMVLLVGQESVTH